MKLAKFNYKATTTAENGYFHLFFRQSAHGLHSTSSVWYTANSTKKQMKKRKQAKKREENINGIPDDRCLTEIMVG
jgi:hypothetical protein